MSPAIRPLQPAAVTAVTAAAENFIAHVDVDVLDFFDTPAADVPIFGRGLTLPQLVSLLRVLFADRRCRAVTFVEHHPDHDEPAGATTLALVRAPADEPAPR